MMRILISDAMIRFYCGFGAGCIAVFAGVHGLFNGAF